MDEQALLERIIAFHGHYCRGLTIGHCAALTGLRARDHAHRCPSAPVARYSGRGGSGRDGVVPAAPYVALGVVLGAVSDWRRVSRLDSGLLAVTLGLGFFPAHVLALALIVLVAVTLRALPLGGARSALLLSRRGMRRLAMSGDARRWLWLVGYGAR